MRIPVTLAGLAIGLLAGVLAASKELLARRFPTVGVIIAIGTPVVAFIFEELAKLVFHNVYREKIAGAVYTAWRWLLNESFFLQLNYSLRFDGRHNLDADMVAGVLGIGGNAEPRISFKGENFLHLAYESAPLRLAVRWAPEVSDDNGPDGPQEETAFVITLEPDIRDLVIRNAPRDVDAIAQRLDTVGDKLIELIGRSPLRLMIASAWLVDAKPLSGAIRDEDVDKISQARVVRGDGWVQLAGNKPSILSATIRYVRILEPPQKTK